MTSHGSAASGMMHWAAGLIAMAAASAAGAEINLCQYDQKEPVCIDESDPGLSPPSTDAGSAGPSSPSDTPTPTPTLTPTSTPSETPTLTPTHTPTNVPGACCVSDGEAIQCLDGIDPELCVGAIEDAIGASAGPGTTCDATDCSPLFGACCTLIDEAPCVDLVPGDLCVQAGFDFQGPTTTCDPNPCPTPVLVTCCIEEFPICLEGLFTEELCESLANGGTVVEDGCAEFPCGFATQACCGGDICLDADPALCIELEGTPLGTGTSCSVTGCPDTPTPTPTTTPTQTPTNTPARDGAPCSTAGQCISENCVEGICCNEPCTGAVERCDIVGQEGTCLSIAAPAPAASHRALALAVVLLLAVGGWAFLRRERIRHYLWSL